MHSDENTKIEIQEERWLFLWFSSLVFFLNVAIDSIHCTFLLQFACGM